jgi:omega-6 fatty acid desaturase (delta-12 desaturase)
MDLALYIVGLCVIVASKSILVKAVIGIALGIVISRCFILGHDACHRSLFTSSVANRVVGRLLFLPSLTPYTLWEIGHNTVHHGYDNLRGRDQVWVPFSPQEFAHLPPYRKALERAYRSIYGLGLYYTIELWWNKLFFPNLKHVGVRRPMHVVDSVLVLLLFLAQTFAVAFVSKSASAACADLLFAIVIPLVVWKWTMGFTIYVHHTHPSVHWFDKRSEWNFEKGVDGAVHVVFPVWVDMLMHWIYQHPAHHAEVKIVSYRLRAAQVALESCRPNIVAERWSLEQFMGTIRHCQLYDYDLHRWVQFDAAAK